MSRLFAWCAGATVGLVVGALLGDAVRTDAELRAARRTARRLGAAGALAGASETPEAGNGAQNGVQRCGLLDPIGRNRCSLRRGHDGMHRNPDAHDVPWPTPLGWVDVFGIDPHYTDDDSEVEA